MLVQQVYDPLSLSCSRDLKVLKKKKKDNYENIVGCLCTGNFTVGERGQCFF